MDWLERIKELGIKPPESDRLILSVDLPPVSLQASSRSKKYFIHKVRNKCNNYSFLLSGDVQVEITWHIHEQERYETDRSPDVDNIIKPLLDALSGPDGILIDDNQVQNVCCSWIDWTKRGEKVMVELRFFLDEWIPKDHVQFVQFDKGLCYPIATYFPKEIQESFVNIYEKGFAVRADAEKHGASYEYSRGLMPMARVFHRSRINGFPVITLEEFKNGK